MDDSTIMCDEVTESNDEETKTVPTNFDQYRTFITISQHKNNELKQGLY